MNEWETLVSLLQAAMQGTLTPADQARLLEALPRVGVENIPTLVTLAHNNIGDGNVFGDDSISIVIKNDYKALAELLERVLNPGCMLHQIPSPPRDFVGRENELGSLRDAMRLGGVSISGLAGMGGVGKSALAFKLAEEVIADYPDAGLYIDLRGVEKDPIGVAEALQFFIRSFEPTVELPIDVPSLQAMYRSLLHDKKALLILDNARDETQVEPLLPPANCAVIVTSRQYFAVPGLSFEKLGTLSPEDSISLLLRIAPRIGEHAAQLAQRLGHLPLALRLAAGFLSQKLNLSPQEYIQRLEDRNKRLELIQASMDLSYTNLTDEAQLRWRVLGVFGGTFDVEAVSSIWELKESETVDFLGELVSFNLVEWLDSTKRYRLHDLSRDFALSCLAENEGEEFTRTMHGFHYLKILGKADDYFLAGNENILTGLKLFDTERENIDDAQKWAMDNWAKTAQAAILCMHFPNAGIYILKLRKTRDERIKWLSAALDSSVSLGNRRLEGNALGNLGFEISTSGNVEWAIALNQRALLISRELGDQRAEANELSNLGIAYDRKGEYRRSIVFYEKALKINREILNRREEGNNLGNIGNAYYQLGKPKRALEYHKLAHGISVEIGDRLGESHDLGNMANAFMSLNDADAAFEAYSAQLNICSEIGAINGEAMALSGLASIHGLRQNTQTSLDLWKEALAAWEQTGDKQNESKARVQYAVFLHSLGNKEDALAAARHALIILDELQDVYAHDVRVGIEKWDIEGNG